MLLLSAFILTIFHLALRCRRRTRTSLSNTGGPTAGDVVELALSAALCRWRVRAATAGGLHPSRTFLSLAAVVRRVVRRSSPLLLRTPRTSVCSPYPPPAVLLCSVHVAVAVRRARTSSPLNVDFTVAAHAQSHRPPRAPPRRPLPLSADTAPAPQRRLP